MRCALTLTLTAAMTACTANSQEKNYKLLEEDRPMFETEHKPMSVLERHYAALADDKQIVVDTAPGPTGGTANTVIPQTFEDRSAWDVVTVGPADGRTLHWPVYFRDCPYEAKPVNPVTPEAAFEQYLSGDTHDGWSACNAAAAATQPVKFLFDLAVLPVRLVIEPPLVNQTSP